jgi:DNA mismatch endonuclease (patch repair protein)
MAAIRSRDTKPEIALRRALRENGLLGYRCHPKGLPGKPDIAFTRWRLAIFVDGCFWHGHPDHYRPSTLSSYWNKKIQRTQERDREQEAALRAAGWEVLVSGTLRSTSQSRRVCPRSKGALAKARVGLGN